MKKFVSVVLTLCLCMSSGITALAADSSESEVISIDEYTATLKAEAAKYNIDCEVLSYDPEIQITRAMLNDEIKQLSLFASTPKTYVVATPDILESTDLGASGTIHTNDNDSQLRSMPVRRYLSTTFSVGSNSPIGRATIKVKVDVHVNVQNGNVMHINDISIYQTGYALNLESWTLNSYSYRLNKPNNGWVAITIYGAAIFSVTNPSSGVKVSYTDAGPFIVTIDCN